jgi:hypothetical protein
MKSMLIVQDWVAFHIVPDDVYNFIIHVPMNACGE